MLEDRKCAKPLQVNIFGNHRPAKIYKSWSRRATSMKNTHHFEDDQGRQVTNLLKPKGTRGNINNAAILTR